MDVPQSAWKIIEEEILAICHGTVTLIVQDGRIIQIDKTEKIRLTSEPPVNPKQITRQGDESIRKNLRNRISQVLCDLKFGQVSIVIKDQKVSQIDRLEKQRVSGLEGLFGEGI